jgi:glycosyltransferase involved in cell wall biosynthesis/Flp pilus assembly protein TadD
VTPQAAATSHEPASAFHDSLRARLDRARAQGDLHGAHRLLRLNSGNEPHDSALWRLLGHLCLESGDADSALRCFREALTSDPAGDDALDGLVQSYVAAERYPEAALVATKWTESLPGSFAAWVALARLRLMAGQTVPARDALRRALAIKPEDGAVQEALAAVANETDSPDPAEDPASALVETPLPFLAPLRSGAVPPSPTDPPILWAGAALSLSSYGIHTRQSIVWLRQGGFRVEAVNVGAASDAYLRTLDAAELHDLKGALTEHVRDGVFVMHHTPATADDPDCYRHLKWRRPDQLAYAAFTTFETEGLPKHWIAPLNHMDEVWVYSDFNARAFAEAGVREEKLRVIGAGVDTAVYDPEKVVPMARPIDRGFMFLSVFQWHSRKGWPVLVETFARTFSRRDDVCLVIKTTPVRGDSRRIEDQISAHLAERGLSREQAAPILVIEEDMNDAEMRALYRATDAFVLPTRGEGWGIPFHEAMAMGLPVIGTRWSGHLQFMNDRNSFLIDVRRLVDADDMMLRFNIEYAGLRYAEPDAEHLMQLMRQVVEDREKSREVGRRARADIRRDWSREAYVQRIRALARHLAGRAEGRRKRAPTAQAKRRDILPVILHGPALDPCGYAHDFRNLLLGLRRAGVDLRFDHQTWNSRNGLVDPAECAEIVETMDPERPAGPHIAIENSLVPPPDPDPKAYRIVRSFWETDRYPLHVADRLRSADEIWVSCSHNADALVRSGIRREKVRIMPVALNAAAYGPHAPPLEWADPSVFTFLSCFDVTLRKGWDLLLKAFFEEFGPTDDVGLLLNLHSSQGADRDHLASHVERWAKRFAGKKWLDEHGNWSAGVSPVRCVPRELNAAEMPSFYQSGDAYVMASRGEGWAIPAMEAMASALPVVATAWGGHMDYMNEENAFLVPYRLAPVSADACREAMNFAGQMWAEPDLATLRKQMRLVREDSAVAGRRAAAGRELILREYSREAVNAKVMDRLREISSMNHAQRKKPQGVTKKLSVVWEGCQLFRSSLALVNRELAKRLDESGRYALHLLPNEPAHQAGICHPRLARRLEKLMDARVDMPCDVYVRHGWPPDFSRPPRAKKFVMMQPWEFGRTPDSWAPAINSQVDELWVYSRHIFETYVESGVAPEKVWLVPIGVDLDLFKPDGPRMELPTTKRFRFLFVGGTIWRKGIDLLLKAYCSAFRRSDDVCLVIKDMGGKSFYKGQCAEETIRGLQARTDVPEVLYLTEDLTDAQMAMLYRSCDCLALPYRGEGFGLPVAEAGACGLPVIVSLGGATDDFVPPGGGYFVQCRRAAYRMSGEFAADGWVLEPDMPSLAHQMRTAFQGPAERDRRRKILCNHVRGRLGWGPAAKAVEMRLRALLGE